MRGRRVPARLAAKGRAGRGTPHQCPQEPRAQLGTIIEHAKLILGDTLPVISSGMEEKDMQSLVASAVCIAGA